MTWRSRRGASTGLFACIIALSAQSPLAQTFEFKDCDHADRAWLALRACTAVLQSSNLDNRARARAFTRRGLAWIIEDEPAEAIEDFNRALDLDASDLEARAGRARAYTLTGSHALAARDWTAIIDKEPDSEDIFMRRGKSWLAAGNTDAALADFSSVLARNPRSADGHIGKARVYVVLKDRAKALEELARGEEIDPRHFAPYLARAEAAEVWGDIPLAIENYSKALSLKTTVWAARKSLKRLGIDTPP